LKKVGGNFVDIGVDLSTDALATVIPFMPAGASKIKRGMEAATEVAKHADEPLEAAVRHGGEALESAREVAEDAVGEVAEVAARTPAMLGRQGENAIRQATGLAKNTESFVVNGRTRIPDFVTGRSPSGAPTGLIESKNVQYQSLTRQLRDYADLVRPAGGRVDVALPPGARVSRPLQRAFDDADNPLFRMDLPQ